MKKLILMSVVSALAVGGAIAKEDPYSHRSNPGYVMHSKHHIAKGDGRRVNSPTLLQRIVGLLFA